MRIAVVNWTCRRVGGIETYLHGVVPALARLGHQLAFWHEVDSPADRERIALPDSAPRWCVAELGTDHALAALGDWCPDLVWVHGVVDLEIEEKILSVAPAVYFAHAYSGTCISGAKAFTSPVVRPCSRRFGWPCLLHYYPHRCGGWNPWSMVREYRRQVHRLELLHRYRLLMTLSDHIRQEYARHGIPTQRITMLPYPLVPPAEDRNRAPALSLPLRQEALSDQVGPWRLLFLGRMERVKGGQILLEALGQLGGALDRPIHVTFAGDGPERASWERLAARLCESTSGITTEFTGWVSTGQMDALWARCDLVVVPSLWPEPYGLAGPEALLRGVPVAAFAVGGIPEWLTAGRNGHLAPGDPPTAAGLAGAIARCLRDPQSHAALCAGAAAAAERLRASDHLAALQRAFRDVIGPRLPGGALCSGEGRPGFLPTGDRL